MAGWLVGWMDGWDNGSRKNDETSLLVGGSCLALGNSVSRFSHDLSLWMGTGQLVLGIITDSPQSTASRNVPIIITEPLHFHHCPESIITSSFYLLQRAFAYTTSSVCIPTFYLTNSSPTYVFIFPMILLTKSHLKRFMKSPLEVYYKDL